MNRMVYDINGGPYIDILNTTPIYIYTVPIYQSIYSIYIYICIMFICLQYGEPPQNEFMSLDGNLQRSWDFGPLWDEGPMGQNSKKVGTWTWMVVYKKILEHQKMPNLWVRSIATQVWPIALRTQWTGKASGEIVVTTLLLSGWPCKLGPEPKDVYHVASWDIQYLEEIQEPVINWKPEDFHSPASGRNEELGAEGLPLRA